MRRGRGSRVGAVALISARVVVALLSVAVLAAAGIGWRTLHRFQENVNTTDVLTELSSVPNSPPVDDGATDILLVGSDSRTDMQGNPLPAKVLRELRTEASDGVSTDTLIVLRIPNNGGKAHAISIPRDTYVPIAGYREDKINSAYGAVKFLAAKQMRESGATNDAEIEQKSDQAGRRALVQAVQDLTGLRVDHYAEINLYGFYLLTDAVGGVEICLNHATSDPDSGANFRRGAQTVSGGDALSFVRQRKNLPRGDLDRIVRQQVFLASAAQKILSAGTLTDPTKLNGLLDATKKSVVLDQNWNIAGFLQQAQGLASGNLDFTTIPVTDINGHNDRGQSIVTVDRDQVHSFVTGLLSADKPAPTSAPAATSSAPQGTPAAPTTSDTTARLAPPPVIQLDGQAGRARAAQEPPITVAGTRCVD
ncbi:LytR family transcriptional regulator [Solihabitans fulvus]|uniref:LytR family transcriptional regulator n=1 Tax=Solihabitans fulvus TaxID=1892852 RepID=A0A5B2XDG2_9PSEU|nr:LytR family transcriptional regulator [Solihabitans fulvus]